MQWTHEAENAAKKVPFFVCRKVRARVEKVESSNASTPYRRLAMTRLLPSIPS